ELSPRSGSTDRRRAAAAPEMRCQPAATSPTTAPSPGSDDGSGGQPSGAWSEGMVGQTYRRRRAPSTRAAGSPPATGTAVGRYGERPNPVSAEPVADDRHGGAHVTQQRDVVEGEVGRDV